MACLALSIAGQEMLHDTTPDPVAALQLVVHASTYKVYLRAKGSLSRHCLVGMHAF